MTLKECRRQKAQSYQPAAPARAFNPCWRCGLVVFGILHSTLILVSPSWAQLLPAAETLQQPRNSFDQQTDIFRRLLFDMRFRPLESFADLEADPSHSLLIVMGDPRCLSANYLQEGARKFLERGGAALIVTDLKTKGEAGENLKKLAGVTVTGEKLVVRGPIPNLRYLDSPFCPFIEPHEDWKFLDGVTDFIGTAGKPDLFRRHLDSNPEQFRVATNAPSFLKISSGLWLPPGIVKLARLPRVSEPEDTLRNLLTRSEKYPIGDDNGPLFAVGGMVGQGRVLVLADHSIFINRMILPPDNNNLEFAANCLHWLRGGILTPMEAIRSINSGPEALEHFAGNRNKALFWDDGSIQKTFEVPLKMAPLRPALPSEPAIVAAIDQTIAKLEENNSFNYALLQQIDELPGGRRGVIRLGVYLLTLAALAFLSYRFLWRTRHRPESAFPLPSEVLREHEPKSPLLDQRRRALLRSGNVWEVGHCLAREFFGSLSVPLTGRAPHVVMVHGGRWQRWRARRRVARLWRLACGDAAKRISSTTLRLRLREMDELKTALANGTIELNAECRINHGSHG